MWRIRESGDKRFLYSAEGAVAAVDGDYDASDEGGDVAEQIEHRADYLFWLAKAVDRGVGYNLLAAGLEGSGGLVGEQEAVLVREEKPGAMALQRTPIGATCTANHCVKLLMEPLAAEYAGILVSGRTEFILEMLSTTPLRASIISREKTIVERIVPWKLVSKTFLKPSTSRP